MKKFFYDDAGKASMGRLLSFSTCAIGWVVGIIMAFKGDVTASAASIPISFVLAGLGQKVMAKYKE